MTNKQKFFDLVIDMKLASDCSKNKDLEYYAEELENLLIENGI